MSARPIGSFLARRGGVLLPACALVCLAAGVGPTDGGGFSFDTAIAGSGRLVCFSSLANNLVAAADANASYDLFVRDTKAGTTTLETVATDGTQANAATHFSAISANGRWVAFATTADNLVADDANLGSDIFLRDRKLGTTILVSANDAGAQGDQASDRPSISADGRFVCFTSSATNLVSGDTNFEVDAFVRDVKLGHTERVSVATDGTQQIAGFVNGRPAISPNGRWVAFSSSAENLVADDSNGQADVFVHDRKLGTTTRASLTSAGAQSTSADSFRPSVSNNGRWVAWVSSASDFVEGDTNGLSDVFVRDTKKGVTTCVSVTPAGATGAGSSTLDAGLSASGRFVAFESAATDLVAGDDNAVDDIFVRDVKKGVTTRASVASDGTQADDFNFDAALSNDGRKVAFVSLATTLAAASSNGLEQIFVHDRKSGKTICASVSSDGELADTVP